MRFLLRFYLSFLLLASTGLTLLFGTTSYALLVHHIRQVAAMLHGSEVQDVFTPERYAALRLVLAAIALLALGLGVWLKAWRVVAISRLGSAWRPVAADEPRSAVYGYWGRASDSCGAAVVRARGTVYAG
jgi:hypothetical protein